MKTIVGYFILPLNSEMVLDRAGNFSRLRSHCGGGVSVLAGFCPQTPYMGDDEPGCDQILLWLEITSPKQYLDSLRHDRHS